MGLPLFVAPVESDLKTRSSEKISSLRPTRSSIRHTRRPEVARAIRRRAHILRETFQHAASEPRTRPSLLGEWEHAGYPPPSDPPARYPWIETGQLPPPEAYNPLPEASNPPEEASNPPSAPSPLPYTQWAPWEMRERHGVADDVYHDPTMEANSETLMILFRERAALIERSASPTALLENANQLARLRRHELSGNPEPFRREQIAPSVAARFDRSPERDQAGPTTAEGAPRPRPTGRPAREGSTFGERRTWDRLRSTFGVGVGVDGLGDRTRSISPESWETLLSTLTPDPQPPSASSSFASASAFNSAAISQRQSAAASSRTSFAEPEPTNENITEQPCESGHDESESEDDQPVVSMRPQRPSANYPSRYRRFVSMLDSNDHSSTSHVRADRPGLRSSLPDRIMDAQRLIHERMVARGSMQYGEAASLTSGGILRRSDPRLSMEERREAQAEHDQTQADGAPNVDEIAWAILRSLADHNHADE